MKEREYNNNTVHDFQGPTGNISKQQYQASKKMQEKKGPEKSPQNIVKEIVFIFYLFI